MPNPSELNNYAMHPNRRVLLLAGLSVAVLGFLGMLGRLFHLPVLGSFNPALGMVDAMSFASGISLFCFGFGMILSFWEHAPPPNVKPYPQKLALFFILVPLIISIYTLLRYLSQTHFDLWWPLTHSISTIAISFVSALNMFLTSGGLLLFNRYRDTPWVPYALGLVGLFIMETTCFSLVGRWTDIPVLFSFVQSIPSIIAFFIIGLTLVYETIFYQGMMSPLFSSNPKIRRFSILGVATSALILGAGIFIIHVFHSIVISGSSLGEADTLLVCFEFATILLSILVMALSLRLLVFFEQSLLSEANAKESEARFRLLVSAVQDYAIYRLNPNGQIETWNEGAERITGYQTSDILGKSIGIFYPDDVVTNAAPMRQLEITARQGHYEFSDWRVRKNGQLFWARSSLTSLLDDSGELIGFSGVIRDLTRQKEMEDSLKASINELTHMKQAIDAASIVVRTDLQGVITYVNDAFCAISKYTRDELIGRTHRLVNSGYHQKSFFKDMWDTILQGRIWHGEIRNRAKDGTYYWVDTTIYPFQEDHEQPGRYIAIHHDITPLKTAEETLRKHAYQQKIISLAGQHALSGISIVDLMRQTIILTSRALKAPYGAILELQPNGDTLVLKAEFGWSTAQVEHLTVLTGDNSQAGFTLMEGEPVIVEDFSRETRFRPPSFLQDYPIASGMSVVIRGESVAHPFGVLIIHGTEPRKFDNEDVMFLQTMANVLAVAIERKNAELTLQAFSQELEQKVQERTQELEIAKQEAEEANRQKTRVLAFVSHDFKNPLAAMSRFADMIEKEESHLTPKQSELIQYISEGIAQLRAMVTSILDKARMEQGRLSLSLEWVELAPLLKEMKPIIDSLAEPRNITITMGIQPPDLALEADPQFLRQIILNLLSNAIKYNKRGGQAWLAFKDTENHQFVELTVQDTGVGIPHEKMATIFKEYFRAGPASYDHVEGTGLGLAFIKRLVEMHGGQIDVTSEVGVGSTFTVRLPNKVRVSPVPQPGAVSGS